MMKLIALVIASSVLAGQTPVFRSGATLVPLDVRVLDKNGKPITDLRQDEFVIVENGRPQSISHFSATGLTAMSASDAPALLRTNAQADALAPQTRRVFLLLLGRGRLQPPAKGVDAMLEFVRQRVLPQDQVAVLAWNRATDFTTNHAGIVELLERFKVGHERIETDLGEWFNPQSLRFSYGDKAVPAWIQKSIDDMFAVPSLRAAHTLVSDPNARTGPGDAVNERAEAIRRAEALKDRIDKFMTDPIDPMIQLGITSSLDKYMASLTATLQDLGNLYAGIEYLRFIDGEKHVVFVTEQGLTLPDYSMDMALAAVANNARVVVDTIQTGGNPTDSLVHSLDNAKRNPQVLPPIRFGFGPISRMQTLRELSRQTGGLSSVYGYASKAAEKIDEATRFGYLLGYYASNGVQDGTYRRIDVKVSRPGAQVLFRHGYFARPQNLPPNRRDMMSYTRIATALTTAVEVYDIPLGFRTREEKDGQQQMLAVDVNVGLAKLTPARTAAGRQYDLELAVVCSSAQEKVVGQYSQRVSFTLNDEQYAKAMKDGASASIRMPVTSFATYVKVVVYNFENDLLGSITKKIR